MVVVACYGSSDQDKLYNEILIYFEVKVRNGKSNMAYVQQSHILICFEVKVCSGKSNIVHVQQSHTKEGV